MLDKISATNNDNSNSNSNKTTLLIYKEILQLSRKRPTIQKENEQRM